MSDATPRPDPGSGPDRAPAPADPAGGPGGPGGPAAVPGERFEVIVDEPGPEPAGAPRPGGDAESSGRATAAAARIEQVSALDLDRLPDREHVRLLVDAEQLDRLRAAGLPVRVRRSVPIAPLDPALIAGDDEVTGWLTARLGPADPSGRDA